VKYFRLFLFPFSFLYWIISSVKNFLYETKLIKSFRVNKKIICIGNITTGGTGKTPITISIAKALLNQKKKIAILSRGYKRLTKGFLEVDEINAEKFGDEPAMIFSNLPEAKVLVSENRVSAVNKISELYDLDFILMDDGLQNRKIQKDYTIAVINKESQSFLDKIYLPAGNLRESRARLNNYNSIIMNYKFKPSVINLNLESNNFTCEYVLNGLYNINNEKIALENIIGNKVMAFCCIAHPHSFFEMLSKLNVQADQKITYSDHYNFTSDEIDALIRLMKQKDFKLAITTEKDFVRIKNFSDEFISNGCDLLHTKISAEIKNLSTLINDIMELNQ
jgi:tetraacyldisaccharide 4'-kinase